MHPPAGLHPPRCKELTTAPAAPAPQGNRETAHKVLADKGVSILTGAQVNELRRAGAPSVGSAGSGDEASAGGGEDLAKRLVLLTDKEGQQEVRGGAEAAPQGWFACPCCKHEGANAMSGPSQDPQRPLVEALMRPSCDPWSPASPTDPRG